MQNGNPMFWAYKIAPFDTNKQNSEEEKKQKILSRHSLNNMINVLYKLNKKFQIFKVP